MRIILIGASGFVGRRLSAALQKRGEKISAVSFHDMNTVKRECDGADVVINLAGENVATRWTPQVKERIRSSRIDVPRELIASFATMRHAPKAYLSASAVGYYGTHETQTFTETSPPGDDFLAGVCVAWEKEAVKAAEHGCRTAIVRTGLALGADGGALARLLPIFKFGGGGVIGTGNQWCSWIHIDDLVGIYLMAIYGGSGIFNATAPNPVRNHAFTRALAAVLHRPAMVPVPTFIVERMLGEGAMLLTKGQCVIPERTRACGYAFQYTVIDRALAALLLH
jgi:uncharacterized protein (TIGR01777 family)